MITTWEERLDRTTDNFARGLVDDLAYTFDEYGFDVDDMAEYVEPWWEKYRHPRIAEAIWQEKLYEDARKFLS